MPLSDCLSVHALALVGCGEIFMNRAKILIEFQCLSILLDRTVILAHVVQCFPRIGVDDQGVRELENAIERAMILAGRDAGLSLANVLPLDSLKSVRETNDSAGSRAPRTKRELREMERSILVQALERARWKVAGSRGAAAVLGVPPSTLTSRMRALGIKRPTKQECHG